MENPAVIAALVGGAVALLAIAAKMVFDVGVKHYDFWENRRSAIIRFRTDLELSIEAVSRICQTDETVYTANMVSTLQEQQAEGRPFSLFGADVADLDGQRLILDYMATLPRHSQRLVGRAILQDRQMRGLYRSLQAQKLYSPDVRAEDRRTSSVASECEDQPRGTGYCGGRYRDLVARPSLAYRPAVRVGSRGRIIGPIVSSNITIPGRHFHGTRG